jgi:hypothetical protein
LGRELDHVRPFANFGQSPFDRGLAASMTGAEVAVEARSISRVDPLRELHPSRRPPTGWNSLPSKAAPLPDSNRARGRKVDARPGCACWSPSSSRRPGETETSFNFKVFALALRPFSDTARTLWWNARRGSSFTIEVC